MNLFNRQKIYSIQKLSESDSSDPVMLLEKKIKLIDKQIFEINKAIFQAQSVRLRSIFSGQNNFFDRIQKRMIHANLDNSLEWHKQRLGNLLHQKNLLQDKLDRLTGKVWQKRFKKWVAILMMWIALSLMVLIILMGIFATLYLLPIIGFLAALFIFYRKTIK